MACSFLLTDIPSSKKKTQISNSSAEFNVFLIIFFSFTWVNTNCRPIIGGEIKRQPCRGSAIPWGSDDTSRIHLQSPVQRFAGEKVRGRRRMLLDVRRMYSLSGKVVRFSVISPLVCYCQTGRDIRSRAFAGHSVDDDDTRGEKPRKISRHPATKRLNSHQTLQGNVAHTHVQKKKET